MTTKPGQVSSCSSTFLSIFMAFILFSPFCRAGQVNVTIDDSFGDQTTGFKPTYLPEGYWEDRTCSGCAIQPDPSKAYRGTWRAVTYRPKLKNVSFTLEFTGIAIWIFFILPNAIENKDWVTTNTSCKFTLDGSDAGSFDREPDLQTHEMMYNTSVFSKTGLSNTPHQLIVSTSGLPFHTYINFDYAIYTTMTGEDSATSVPAAPETSSATSTSMSSSLPSSPRSPHASDSSTPTSSSLGLFSVASSSSTSSTLAPSTTSSHSQTNTSNQSSNTTHQSTLIGTIVGAVLGSFLILLLALLFLCRRFSKFKLKLSESSRRSSSPLNSHAHLTSALQPLARIYRTQVRGERSQTKLRIERQREIERRLQSARLEMETLASENDIHLPLHTSGMSPEGAKVVDVLREQVEILKSKIESLEQAKQSDWAMGLSDKKAAIPTYGLD